MAFSFDFASDDIEEDLKENNEEPAVAITEGTQDEDAESDLFPPKLHTLKEMVRTYLAASSLLSS